MSAEHARAAPHPSSLPPPPPLPPTVVTASSPTHPPHQVPRPPPLRRLAVQQPPSITTSLAVPQAGTFLASPTPASAVSFSGVPFSPYASSAILTPGSTLPSSTTSLGPSSPMASRTSVPMAYNPQEWNRHGPVTGNYMPHSGPSSARNSMRTDNMTGMEAQMPSPPPPYSPRSLAQAAAASPHMSSSAFAPSSAISPAGTTNSEYASSTASSRTSQNTASPFSYDGPRTVITAGGSPQPPAAPSFPPPPGRDRSASRTRDILGIFNRHKAPEAAANMEALSQNTSHALQRAPGSGESSHRASSSRSGITISTTFIQQQEWSPQEGNVRPPASRRAASTGAIGSASASRSGSAEESPSRRGAWEPGMPLPPPPPGPPPPGSRSASTSRTPDSFYSSSSNASGAAPAMHTRRPPQTGTALEPIPPTPAGWIDEDMRNRSRSPAARGLHLDTIAATTGGDWSSNVRGDTTTPSGTLVEEAHTAHPTADSTSGLSRSYARRREPSARGIRERRSESRAARERTTDAKTAVEASKNPWAQDMDTASGSSSASTSTMPADLVLASSSGGALSRRRANTRNSRVLTSPLDLSDAHKSPKRLIDPEPSSNTSTPRTSGLKVNTSSPEPFAPTPPFSPCGDGPGNMLSQQRQGSSSSVSQKTLPTPPPQQYSEHSFSSLAIPKQADRPVSHILHVPNEDIAMPAPLSPIRPPSAGILRPNSAGRTPRQTPKPTEKELFAQASVERHRTFIEKEMAAQTDQERLELFAEFIVAESRMRRDRYSAAFDSMASEIFDLTRDLWRSYHTTGRRSTTPNASSAASSTMEHSADSFANTAASSASSNPNYTPRSDAESPSSVVSRTRGESQLWDRFEPCLSPIPSMNVSTVPDDEEDSRGRSASRWWEASADGSQGRGGKKLERSKRESKYMGVPKEAREYLQWDGENSPAYTGTPGPSGRGAVYGPNEYPPEKVGLHDSHSLPASAKSYHFFSHSAPTTPDPYKLDVSRLVTLPPPYPRHHPAVNNNHPDLASIRTIHRNLGELDEVANTKDHFIAKVAARREQGRLDAAERRNKLRLQIQEQIRADRISFADAAKAESEFEYKESRRAQELAQAEFDGFQKEVMSPLHAIFSERVTRATATIDHLRSGLFEDAQDPSPNNPQEEGDEQPELLEKLTLLKWLFEIRETLHRQMFDLEGERNERYKHVVVTPYIMAGNREKLEEAEAFFMKDAQDRDVVYEKESLKRFEEFAAVIERMVTRGVEDQLSAFWDIAPGLLAVVQKVPNHLEGFQVLVPPDEYSENPAYLDHPLQYLYTLLTHAKKSAYQYIESQTNLLCLLHEAKSGVMTANTRLLETQRLMEGENKELVEAEMSEVRADEEARLTIDLKEKVGLVEGQWAEALGSRLEDCRRRVEKYLVGKGGWDESLAE